MNVKRLILIAMCTTVLFVQEQMLMIVPNVQFTTLLIVLYASMFRFRETVAIVVVYVLLDNMFMSSFHPLYTPPMFIGWLTIPVMYHTLLRKTKREMTLAFFGLFFGFYYGWVFIPFRMIEQGVGVFWNYLILDIPFEIIMAVSNFLTILWLYRPLYKTLSDEMTRLESENGYVADRR